MNCLLNTGVMLVKRSDWSRQLWHSVWNSEIAPKFYLRPFHEQSVLVKQLRGQGELQMGNHQGTRNFHSFDGGPVGPKRLGAVWVLDRDSGFNCADSEHAAPFIFHAAGKPGKGMSKLQTLQHVASKFQLQYSEASVVSAITAEAPSSSLAQLLTVVVTTSPIPDNPSTELLQETIESFSVMHRGLLDCRILIVCDGVRHDDSSTSKWKRGLVTAEADHRW